MKKIIFTLIALAATISISAQQRVETIESWSYQTIDSVTVGMNLTAVTNPLGNFYLLKVEVRNGESETLEIKPEKQLKAFYITNSDKVKKLKVYSDQDYAYKEKREDSNDRNRYGLSASTSSAHRHNTYQDVDQTRNIYEIGKEVKNPNRIAKMWYLNEFLLKQGTKITGYAFLDYKKCKGVQVEYTIGGNTFVFQWEGITLAETAE